MNGHFVADEHRAVECHTVHSNCHASAARPSRCCVSGRQIHLRHQPTAENVACRIGVGRHRDGADHRGSLGAAAWGLAITYDLDSSK
jgi:hypothetical protein